jgi:hypothetical protein
MSQHALSGFVSVVIGCMFSVGMPGIGAAADVHTVNLYRGEIDGVLFSQMTLEAITSRFGQPSALEQNDSPPKDYSSKVSYHDLGLSFWLQRPSDNTAPLCRSVIIYLIQLWDAKAGKSFLPFAGRVSKSVNQLWNPSRIETEFKTFYPRNYTREQKETIFKDAGNIFHSSLDGYRVLYIESERFNVDFFYNTSAQLLENIRIGVNTTATSDKK